MVVSSLFKHARCCYQCGRYTDCSSLCQKILSSNSLIDETVECETQLLLGKSSFHIYRSLQYQLQKQARLQLQHTKEYQLKHKECYQIAKVVLKLLGNAFDSETGSKCADLCKMLDLTMIDYLLATNLLDRCLLCQKKAKLRRSHYFPRSLLQEFCHGIRTPKNLKILRPCPSYLGTDKSPKELSYLIFCDECELLFNKYGESQFLPRFFKLLYNADIPSKVKAEQIIQYEEWLYQFCLGMLFRVMAVYHNEGYSNDLEIYCLFNSCRKLLLNPQSVTAKSSKPEFAVFISPQDESLEGSPLSLSTALNPIAGCLLGLGDIAGNDSIVFSSCLHFFLIRFGVINILHLLDSCKSSSGHVPSDCYVNASGGSYHVPKEADRYAIIPKGIQKILEFIAVEKEQELLEWPVKIHNEMEQKQFLKEPKEDLRKMFNIAQEATSVKGGFYLVSPSPFSEKTKVINLLPYQFSLRPEHGPSQLFLPNGHRVIFHSNRKVENDTNETIFLAVGDFGDYSLTIPYVIYHRYKTGLQLSVGFFVSPVDFTFQGFLPDKFPKLMLREGKWEAIEQAKLAIPDWMRSIFTAQGIVNYSSLYHQIKFKG